MHSAKFPPAFGDSTPIILTEGDEVMFNTYTPTKHTAIGKVQFFNNGTMVQISFDRKPNFDNPVSIRSVRFDATKPITPALAMKKGVYGLQTIN